MLAIDTTKGTGACQPQTPSLEEAPLLPLSNNGITTSNICQVSVENKIIDLEKFAEEHGMTDPVEPLDTVIEYTCGSYYKLYIDPSTGKIKTFPLLCGKFRECETCHDRRKQKYKWRVQNGLTYYSLSIIPLEDPLSAEIVSVLDKDQYLRLPAGKEDGTEVNKDGGALFFANTDETKELVNGNTNVDYITRSDSLPDGFPYTWDQLTNTPEGKRPSGSLGKDKPEDEEDEEGNNRLPVAVEVQQITVNTEDKPKFTIAMLRAIDQTSHLDPHNLGELQEAMAERTEALETALKDLEVTVIFKTSLTMHVKISHMKWQVESTSSIHDISIQRQKTGEQIKFT